MSFPFSTEPLRSFFIVSAHENLTRPEYGLRQFVECLGAAALSENLWLREIAVAFSWKGLKDDNENEIPAYGAHARRRQDNDNKKLCFAFAVVVGYKTLCRSSLYEQTMYETFLW